MTFNKESYAMKQTIPADTLQCVYCGSESPTTRDHIPPKCLFASPRPNDLVTVPACKSCNEAYSKDDEYFRLTLSFRCDTGRDRNASAASSAAIRQLQRHEGRAFREVFFRGVQKISLVPEALEPVETGVYDVDTKRLNHVCRRIVMGLYAHHFGKRVPDSCSTDASCVDGLNINNRERLAEFKGLLQWFEGREWQNIGDGSFCYSFLRVKDCDDFPNSSLWLLLFYGKILFLGKTLDFPNDKGA